MHNCSQQSCVLFGGHPFPQRNIKLVFLIKIKNRGYFIDERITH